MIQLYENESWLMSVPENHVAALILTFRSTYTIGLGTKKEPECDGFSYFGWIIN